MSKDISEGYIPCPNLSYKSLSITLIDAGLNSGVSQTQRKKWGRSFADFLFQNASGDFVESMLERHQELKERSEKSSYPRSAWLGNVINMTQ